jgi:PAS domain S-box-containing protein
MKPLKLAKKQLDKLFPTHILLDEHLTIISCASSIESTFGKLVTVSFQSKFSIANCNQVINLDTLKELVDTNISIIFSKLSHSTFNCTITHFDDSEQLLLVIDNIANPYRNQDIQASKANLDINKLDIALEEIGHTFWFHDLDDALELPNVLHSSDGYEGFYDFFGNDSKRVLSKVASWLNSIHPDDLWMIQDADMAYRNGQIKQHALQYRIFDANGNIKWISDKGVVFEYKDGKPKKLICIHTDITELNHAKLELDRQKKFYETILNNLPADIAVFDKNHTYLYVNPRGIKNEEIRQWIIGKKDEDYVELRNLPISVLKGRRQTFNEVKRTLKPKSWEQEIIKPDGSFEYILRIFHPYVNDKDEFELVIGYGINITERKLIEREILKSEARYKNLIDKSLALITTHTLDGAFTMINPMVIKTSGYTADELLGQVITKFMHPDDVAQYHSDYLNGLKQNKRSKGVFRIVNKSEAIVYLLYNNYLMEENGQEPYVISYALDITDRILAEEKLTIAHQKIKKDALSKKRFMANMNHELRTPMNGILGIINFLEKTKLTNKQKEYLALIKGSSDSLLRILNESLDIEKIASGKLKLEQVPFSVYETIADIVGTARYKTDEKGLSIEFKSEITKNQIVVGDPYKLAQIVLNLITNAIKFTHVGGSIVVSVELINENTKDITIEIAVTDTGIGIPKNKLNNIFEPFVQADISISRKYGGTGLGLSICKQLVEMQNGTIKVESAEGKGSVFSFMLTYSKATHQTTLRAKEKEIKLKTNNLKGANILIAEDVEVNQYVLKHLLEQWGCKVTIAENGKEAVDAIRKKQFDLIFMDIQMPEMDGFQATKIIRSLKNKQKAATPIVAVTANILKDVLKDFIKSGMNDYIIKPYSELAILNITEKYIQKAKTNDKVLLTSNYNKAKHKRIAGGNRKFMTETAEIFVRTAPISFNLMQDALANKDWHSMAKQVHKLKFSVDFFGMKINKQLLAQIEVEIASTQKVSALKKMITMFGKELDICIQQLKNDFLY